MIETTTALKSEDTNRRSETQSAQNHGIELSEEHALSAKIPSMVPFSSYLSPHFPQLSSILKLSHSKIWSMAYFGVQLFGC